MKALALAAALVACAPEGGEVDVVWLDYASFEAEVQPILGARCGNPSCHGRPERPLSVYSAGRYRADPARAHLDEPLTEDELQANYERACVFVVAGDPEESPLLVEPLGPYAGAGHGGGAIFEGTTDRDYQILLRWASAGGHPP